MNRDEIIRMARSAGFTQGDLADFSDLIVHFAALVAAAEREECADIADQHASIEGIAQSIAAAIRARGDK